MTRDEEIAWHCRPIDLNDVLRGVRYASAFNGKGRYVGLKRAVIRCRRTMTRITNTSGHRPRIDGAVTLDPVCRALEERRQRMASIVERSCGMCPEWASGVCRGVAASIEL